MPRYWFTTHWPPYDHDGPDILNIYIQEQYRHAVDGMGPGDKVFVYEFRSGPNVTNEEGEVIHRRLPGREAVVCEAEITTNLHVRPGYVPEHFEGRGIRNFRWEALTGRRVHGVVPRKQVNRILGYREGYVYYGFNGGRGIKEISPEEYDELHARLLGALRP
jgi:hypothetical protein